MHIPYASTMQWQCYYGIQVFAIKISDMYVKEEKTKLNKKKKHVFRVVGTRGDLNRRDIPKG